jgi:hypothetical protein
MKIFFCIISMFLFFNGSVKELNDSRPILLLNATIHLGNGESIVNGAIAFDKDKVLFSGDARTLNLELEQFQLIKMEGLHIYPYEIISLEYSDIFVKEFNSLISLYSSMDSTCTARVLHSQLKEPYPILTGKPNFVVIDQQWGNKQPFKLHYVFSNGVMVRSPLK